MPCIFVTHCVISLVILESVGAEKGPSNTVIGDRERTGETKMREREKERGRERERDTSHDQMLDQNARQNF